MDIHSCAKHTTTDKQLHELALLYRFSNTLLSTIRLNKLTHLILTMLTSGQEPLFERAMLFLLNEKTGLLQGMLGVTSETSEGLIAVADEENPLGNRWDISEEIIARQRSSEFSSLVRMSRIDIKLDCPVFEKVITQGRVFYTGNEELTDYPTSFSFLKELDVKEFVAAPLIARDTTIGMLVVDNPVSKQRITVDELRFLKLIAGQAGMAIENSTLYNKLEEAHTDLQDARERLLHGERLAAIGEMAANLVHELKSPLVTIGGFAGRLFKTLPDASREQHYADTILREACRLEKMLADILAFSRKPTICYSNCQMAEILRESFESCATTLEDQSIRLIQPELDDSWVVLGDAHQLKQVFLNLLLNAAESMPDGGIIKVAAEEKTGPDTGSLIISISDTGGGIPAALLSKIFHPFFTTKNKGTGLGLPIVNRIISNHQGSIEAGNEGKGAVFRVTLPLKGSRLPEC
ncbi:MAG: hypothetical protein A2079_03425 [Geobacteraceae bacterium GWC2_48_7]|nr:MAG: hypothetical protein A2079_03425 [Geobacteraceae bacterium GWC2_48_7]